MDSSGNIGNKDRARNEEGKLVKVPEPNPDEMIDPYVFKLTGRAVNYDRRWAGTVELTIGETTYQGVWATVPFGRPNHGELCAAYLKKLREQNKIPWKENCFYFTHDQGKAALFRYLKNCLAGEQKANKKSWENKYGRMTGVTYEQLEKADYSNARNVFEEFVGTLDMDQVIAKQKAHYSGAATPTYINQTEKYRRIDEFLSHNEDLMQFLQDYDEEFSGEMGEITAIAEATSLKPNDVAKLLNKRHTESNIDEKPSEKITISSDVLDLDDDTPIELDTGAMASTITEIEDSAHIDLDDEDGDIEEVLAEAGMGSEVATAAVTAVETPAGTDETDEHPEPRFVISAVDSPHEIESEPVEYHLVNPENLKERRNKFFSDTGMTTVETEGVKFKTTAGVVEDFCIVEIPEVGEVMLPVGKFLIGLAETGKVYLINNDRVDV